MRESLAEIDNSAKCGERESLYHFHLVLFSGEELYELWLPKMAEGHYLFSELREHRFLSVEARENCWVVVCRRPGFIKNVPMTVDGSVVLEDKLLLDIESEDCAYSVYVEKVNQQTLMYKNYAIRSGVNLRIGKQPDCDICSENPYVSNGHAVLSCDGSAWKICDLGSTCGTYVNGRLCEAAELHLGDIIYFPGTRILVGSGFLAIAGDVFVNPEILGEPLSQLGGYGYYGDRDSQDQPETYFNRAPRKQFKIEESAITVEGPPMSMERAQMPLLLRMGGSMVMGGAAALAGNFMTLLSSVLFPVLSSKYTDKQRQDYEHLRLTKYTEYLEKKHQEISNACRKERDILNLKYPPISEIAVQARQANRLWERRIKDEDFLHVRLGSGNLPLGAVIDYPPRRFELETDDLEEKMYKLVEATHVVERAPVTMSLMDNTVCGLLGDRELVLNYVLNIVLQLTVCHSYDEVKLVFLVDEKELERLSAIRYLPHVWDDQKKRRYIATSEAEAYIIGESIQEQIEIEDSDETDVRRLLKDRPYYVIFALNKKLAESHEILKTLMKSEKNHGASIISVYDELPKDVQKIISLRKLGKSVCTTMATNGGADTQFEIERCDGEEVASVMRLLANTRLKTIEQAQEMPKTITFLEMFKAGCIEQLNPLKRWSESNPVKSLAAPVGVGPDGSLFMLDLHEKRQGPHGLVAGMTGSGKSEFIITYILSMAINYHPNEVAFVLIDYKGGGLTGAFENPQTGVRLPHLAGTITNLDGASIQRSLMSIESELVRRQRVFNEVKSAVNEGTMDIYAYQKLFRAGKVSDPMPHLFIISDEFAELKQQQPEFMDKLISAARIGRSLGVHLILATQKPSGVVNDQIRSNTKFRVCLRVQERSDSMDMLKRPEAAELTDTGRFYLQVGYNEYFALGQSAWCGASYEPQMRPPIKRDDSIEFLDVTGQVISTVKPNVKRSDSGKKQIVAVVEYLAHLAGTQGIEQRQLCLPELPKRLDTEKLREQINEVEQNEFSVPIGFLDDPENQKQFPLQIDFKSCQNLLILGDGGKTTLAQSIILNLARNLPPDKVNFYIMDFSSRLMKLFRPLPHCGAVLFEEDSDSFDEFFKMISSLVAERKQLFSELEVDNFEAACELKPMPLVLVVIDNITGLSSSKSGEAHAYKLQSYLKDSVNYGVKYIVTASRQNEVSSRVRQELNTRVCLHLKDKFDYSDVLECKVSYVPPELPGRGLFNLNGRPLELQCAMFAPELDDKNRAESIKNEVGAIRERFNGQAEAQQLPVFSETVTYEEFSRQFKKGRIPLGYAKQTGKPIALPLKQFSLLGLYFGNPAGKQPILTNMLHVAARENMEAWIIRRLKASAFDESSDISVSLRGLREADCLPCTEENTRLLRSALIAEISRRSQMLQDKQSENGAEENAFEVMRENTTPIMLVIESMSDFCSVLNVLQIMAYRELFLQAARFNIYVIACFDGDITTEQSNNSLFALFSQREVLLFGGNLDKQPLCAVPEEMKSLKNIPYNVALMKYRNRKNVLVMPCGEIHEEPIDEDMCDIF